MKRRQIGQVPHAGQPRERFDEAVKEAIETITGERAGKIAPLPATATLADAIAKINELLDRVQN